MNIKFETFDDLLKNGPSPALVAIKTGHLDLTKANGFTWVAAEIVRWFDREAPGTRFWVEDQYHGEIFFIDNAAVVRPFVAFIDKLKAEREIKKYDWWPSYESLTRKIQKENSSIALAGFARKVISIKPNGRLDSANAELWSWMKDNLSGPVYYDDDRNFFVFIVEEDFIAYKMRWL